jgi:hypothetical protein
MLVASAAAALATFTVPAFAGTPADPGCYTCTPPQTKTTDPNQLPFTAGGGSSTASNATQQQSSISSLPFTGADVEEIAAIGVGAVIAGGLLSRRRRSRA